MNVTPFCINYANSIYGNFFALCIILCQTLAKAHGPLALHPTNGELSHKTLESFYLKTAYIYI